MVLSLALTNRWREMLVAGVVTNVLKLDFLFLNKNVNDNQDRYYYSRPETWPKLQNRLIPCKGRHLPSLFLLLSCFFLAEESRGQCLVLHTINQFWRFGYSFHILTGYNILLSRFQTLERLFWAHIAPFMGCQPLLMSCFRNYREGPRTLSGVAH